MRTSEAIDQIAAALAAAQGTMEPALFNRENPHFRSKYADLAAIMQATLPHLSKNGLCIVQTPTLVYGMPEGTKFILYGRLIHKSGQWIEADWPLTSGTPQSMGSQLTYARRYTWSALCGIAADDDDDGEVATYAEATKVKGQKTDKLKNPSQARKDGDYTVMEAEIRAIKDLHTLRLWRVANYDRVKRLPENWVYHISLEYERREAELESGVTEDGKPVEQAAQNGGEAA